MTERSDARAAAPAAVDELLDPAAYAAPEFGCDIVMKGGVTSGVVYPRAACEIARSYRFRSIGGTSAGAIAAAATAAAELGRDRPAAGFAELARLSDWLGARSGAGPHSNLRSLFQPQPAAAPVFRTLLTALDGVGGRGRRVIGALLRNFPLAALAGALPGALLVALAATLDPVLARAVFVLLALLLLAAGALAAAAAALVRRAGTAVPANFFGLCSGMHADPATSDRATSDPAAQSDPAAHGDRAAGPDRAAPLTVWLADLLDRLAGRPADGAPLTFGDLWQDDGSGERAIDLRIMTTNLTHGRPYVLPFATERFYYRDEDFRRLFPARVVEWLQAHPPADTDPSRFPGFHALPDGRDLPVVVAARLSLSFPLLVSAVPLFAIDYTRRRDEDRVPDRCWFSDGGICSNFPVHFFDSQLPGRPTFAINLRPFHIDYPPSDTDEARNSWIPNRNEQGLLEWWDRSIHPQGVGGILSFLAAIKDAMQNWADNAQLKAPGYRDRVVHVSLTDGEGGLNLDMPPALIRRLGLRGQLAARKLAVRFGAEGDGTPLTWDNHRWVRYRSTMSVVERMLRSLRTAWHRDVPGRRSYGELLTRAPDEPPTSYPWTSAAQRGDAIESTHALLDLPFVDPDHPHSFGANAPRPEPVLRTVPRL